MPSADPATAHDIAASSADQRDSYAWLCSAAAVRERCGIILAEALADRLEHFRLRLERLDMVADYVVETIRRNYPDLAIPVHSRWRHFAVGGRDRWAKLAAQLSLNGTQRLRLRLELAMVSVLLDAGAGPAWRYRESDGGEIWRRSEGLAVASFELFTAGMLSGDRRPGVDALGLERLDRNRLAAAFQAGRDNPLTGVEGRLAILQRLAAAMRQRSDLFAGPTLRLGDLLEAFEQRAPERRIAAGDLLAVLVGFLNPIWPDRPHWRGHPLGDCWPHPACLAATQGSATAGLVPFHKLSQWLAYSLFEPLEEAGWQIVQPEQLTGLPEYRNGGLLIDLGLLQLRDPAMTAIAHRPGEALVVEWRALTVCLLDRLADLVRQRLGGEARGLSLGQILEGGTWSAGRRIAGEKRRDASPPLRIDSDGTVF